MPRTRRRTSAAVAEASPDPRTIGQALVGTGPSEQTEPMPNGDAAIFRLPACITERQLKSLLRSDDGYREQIEGLTGEQRAEISNATERQHLHKGAYAMLKKLRK